MTKAEHHTYAVYALRDQRIWTPRDLYLGAAFVVPLLAAYLMTLPGGVGWWDSGELIACAKSLSVAHRPGFPLYVVLGRVLFGFVPDPCLWANAFSAFCAAAALLFLWRGFWFLLGGTVWSAAWMALGGWLLGFSPLFWRQSLRAEVYAPVFLALALVFLLTVAAQRAPDPRYALRRFLAAAYVAGLAFCLHSALAVAAAPVFLLIFLTGDFRPSYRQWLLGAGALLASLSLYLFVPLRAPHALYVWGDPASWSGFWQYLSASDSFGTIAAEAGGTLARIAGLLDVVHEGVPWLLSAVGLAGLAIGALFGHRYGRAPFVLLVFGVAVAATVISQLIKGNFDLQAYLFPLLWALWWGFCRLDPFRLTPRLEKSQPLRWSVAGAFVVLAVWMSADTWARGARQMESFGLELAERWGTELLHSADDGDLIILQDANTDFLLRGIMASEAHPARVTVLNTAFAGALWYRHWWEARFLPAGVVPPGSSDWPRQVATWWKDHRGGVLVDYGAPGWLPVELVPAGWLARWEAAGEISESIPRLDTPEALEDPDWVRTAVWYYYRLGEYYLARGRHEAAAQAWDEGLLWAPSEPTLSAVRAQLLTPGHATRDSSDSEGTTHAP
jgi:hypothetical protein